MLSLDVYETWSNLVKKHTANGACNFQAAACELANLVAAAEREACAVAAWSAGMDAHNNAAGLPCDARETGAQCAAAIRERNNT